MQRPRLISHELKRRIFGVAITHEAMPLAPTLQHRLGKLLGPASFLSAILDREVANRFGHNFSNASAAEPAPD
jgi:hypothetical protein